MSNEEHGNGFNVVNLDIETMVDLNPDKVLFENIGEYNELVIVGYDKEGDLRICTTITSTNTMVALLEKAKFILLKEALFGE